MNHNRALLQAHIGVFFMGLAGVLAHASHFEPWRSTSYRVTLGGILLSAIWYANARGKGLPNAKKSAIFLALGVLLSVHWFAFFQSIKLLGVMMGSALIGLEPVIIALFASLFLKEHMNRRTVVAMGISMIGFLILGFAGGVTETFWLGVAWAIFAYILFAVLIIANRKLVQNESPLLVTTLELLGAIPLSVYFTADPWLPADPAGWGYAIGLGVFCTALAYALYNTSMQQLTAPVVGLMLSLEVVYGILGGWVVGDKLTLTQGIAAIFISNILLIDLIYFFLARKRARAQPTA